MNKELRRLKNYSLQNDAQNCTNNVLYNIRVFLKVIFYSKQHIRRLKSNECSKHSQKFVLFFYVSEWVCLIKSVTACSVSDKFCNVRVWFLTFTYLENKRLPGKTFGT